MRAGVALVGALLVLAGAARAQEPTVRAYVTPGPEVAVGRAFVLNVQVTGSQTVDRDPSLPDIAGFARFLGSSRQSSVSMVNGQTTIVWRDAFIRSSLTTTAGRTLEISAPRTGFKSTQ